MYFRILAAVAALTTFVAATSAEARRSPQRQQAESSDSDDEGWTTRKRSAASERSSHRNESRKHRNTSARNTRDDDDTDSRISRSGERHSGVGPRPGAWCGWYMRTRHGGGPEMNLAANWRNYGRPGSPQVGAIVVWPHHVGEIVGRSSDGQWIVLSGNDGGAVRRRPRSIAGAVVRT